jgi:hypothetical protein
MQRVHVARGRWQAGSIEVRSDDRAVTRAITAIGEPAVCL